jgi:hypothetical protein
MRLGILMAWLLPFSLAAQTVNLKGVVRDDNESLPSAHVTLYPDSITTVSNARGEFVIITSAGLKLLVVSYTGFETYHASFVANKDSLLLIKLHSKVDQLKEVVVTSSLDRQTELFESTKSGTNILSKEDITSIPVLGGEADVIKVLQLLPGTLRGIEGSADLFIRGGAADQNLVLLDDATVYNTSHLFGFVSVFNPDILKSVESMNGAFPANYGGRLSSILNVSTKDELAETTHVSGDVGVIASRLFIDQPLVKNKASIWIAGRRTYIDRVVKLVNENLPYFFYDLNTKILLHPSQDDQLSISFYTGEDILNIFRDRNNDGDGFLTRYRSGNNSQSIKWQRKLSTKWNGTVTALRTAYQYDILNTFRDNRLVANSDIEDVGVKTLFNHQLSKNKFVNLGIDWTRHQVSPSIVNSRGTVSKIVMSSASKGRIFHEVSTHVLYEWPMTSRWLLNTGLRMSAGFVKNKMYVNPEPRVAVRYSLSDTEALKLSYSRMVQYMHRVSNSAVTSPTDVWYPVTDSIQPQKSHQFSVSWQRTFPKEKIFFSLESYFKRMSDLIGLQEGTNLFFNTDFEPKLVQGNGKAYGLEALIRKDKGKITGWISYTLSWSRRQFDAINNGVEFPSRYDRRHNAAIVAQYGLSNRWSVSMVWEFISGSRFTPVIGQYVVSSPSSTGVDLVPVYAPTNSVKLADTHRLDLGIKFKSKPGNRFQYEWFAGVYNVYNRANPVGITIEQNESDGSLQYEQPGLFGLLPFISYRFKF